MVVTPIILSPATLSILRVLSEMFEYLKQIEVTMILNYKWRKIQIYIYTAAYKFINILTPLFIKMILKSSSFID